MKRIVDKVSGEPKHVITGYKPRFTLEVVGEASEDDRFGVVLDEEVLVRFGMAELATV